MVEGEEALVGNVTSGVVRVGKTVRRPAGAWTDGVDAFLRHLRAAGFGGAPEPLGRDEQGRQVLAYVAGEIGDATGTYTLTELAEIGRMQRALHDAAASFVPAPGTRWATPIPPDRAELVCHNDVAPWNLIRAERGWVLIDWDGAAPSSRLWDLAYAAQSMAGMSARRAPAESAARLRAYTDGYGLDARRGPELAALLGRRARAMYHLLETGAREQRQPWARIFTEDGPYWRGTADYLDRHTAVWAAALA
ncbi:phosphotransferase [Catellatospora methionotrophica]|uniref:Phosphotransferase n=1 Tax=Catellatospora methionotrophica TaxID=121620 RepID=A0A8J3PCE6_9ACTN|nr:phosphotransferase [Catellatospora methionotrophica]GIG12361.1 phosphotransferase [Catellatospora methionotrophica]